MFRRGLFFLGLMAATVVVPYVATKEPSKWFSGFGSGSQESASAPAMSPVGAPLRAANGAAPVRGVMPGLEGAPVHDLAEVIRFDATPAWVMSRWARVSTAAAGDDLQGYRVAVVTGTREDDLAGSLTYYFNKQQRVQRITFHGTTGDARRLVTLVTSQYGFERQTTDPSVHIYQVRWNGKPVSQLQIRPARVVRADAAHARYEVAMEINNQS